jgi:hypothetical protein
VPRTTHHGNPSVSSFDGSAQDLTHRRFSDRIHRIGRANTKPTFVSLAHRGHRLYHCGKNIAAM